MAETGANSPVGRGAQPPSSTLPYDTNALLCETNNVRAIILILLSSFQLYTECPRVSTAPARCPTAPWPACSPQAPPRPLGGRGQRPGAGQPGYRWRPRSSRSRIISPGSRPPPGSPPSWPPSRPGPPPSSLATSSSSADRTMLTGAVGAKNKRGRRINLEP